MAPRPVRAEMRIRSRGAGAPRLRPFGLAIGAGLWQLERVGAGGYASGRSAGNTQDNTL